MTVDETGRAVAVDSVDEPADGPRTGEGEAPGPVLARLDRPASDPPVTVAVLADPHVAVDASGTWKVAHRARDRLATAVAAANEHADAAVVAGDLTSDGRPAEFDAVDAVLADLAVPWWAVPGNHDVPKAFDDHGTPPVGAFYDRYDRPPFAREVGDLTLLCLDTASDGGDLRHTWGGRVGEEQRAWLAERLPAVENPVVVGHHPVAALPGLPAGSRWRNFQVEDADAVAACLSDHDAGLVVSAHQHVPAVLGHGALVAGSDGDGAGHGSTVVETLAPAICSFPQASLHVEVDAGGTTLRLVPLADHAGAAEAHGLARNGKQLGRTVVELTERRLAALRSPTGEGDEAAGASGTDGPGEASNADDADGTRGSDSPRH